MKECDDDRELRKKQVLRDMKTCMTYMQKVAGELWDLYGRNFDNWKAAKMEMEAEVLGGMIDDLESEK